MSRLTWNRALVVGVGNYKWPSHRLGSAVEDARTMADRLRRDGCQVEECIDPTRYEQFKTREIGTASFCQPLSGGSSSKVGPALMCWACLDCT